MMHRQLTGHGLAEGLVVIFVGLGVQGAEHGNGGLVVVNPQVEVGIGGFIHHVKGGGLTTAPVAPGGFTRL